MREIGAGHGRGQYSSAGEASRLVEQTRVLAAQLINSPKPQNVSFTFGGTDGLSTAIFGLLLPGDHVVTSVVEHNSVLRPLKHLEAKGIISLNVADCDEVGCIRLSEICEAVNESTRLVCLSHVSNVTGSIQPVGQIKSRLNELGFGDVPLMIDAAQSLGHVPTDVQEIGCDILASSGHKGLLGPLGTGLLFVSDKVANEVEPLRFGGTGTDGSVEIQPSTTPVKFESGNLNVPGIAGLKAGIEFLNSDRAKELHGKSQENSQILLDGLREIGGLHVYGSQTCNGRVGVFSLSLDQLDCREVAGILDSNCGIQARAGLHCAPLMHRALGTETDGGTLRLSLGLFNTRQHIQTTLTAMKELAEIK